MYTAENMKAALFRSGLMLTVLLLLFFSSGFGVVIFVYYVASAGPGDTRLPGVPVGELSFGSLVNDEPDRVIFRGQFVQIRDRPRILEFRYSTPDRVISRQEALNISWQFIPEAYKDYLDRSPAATLDGYRQSISVRWMGKVADHELLVTTIINGVSGRVLEYAVMRSPEAADILGQRPINNDTTPAAQSVIEERLIDFMTLHGYKIPANTRLIECAQTAAEDSGTYYTFRLGIVHGDLLLDPDYEGVFAKVDAVTGEVLTFRYLHLDGGAVTTVGVSRPEVVYQRVAARESIDVLYSDQIESHLRLVQVSLSPYDTRLLFQLSWAFPLRGAQLVEYYGDAFDGSRPGIFRRMFSLEDLFDLGQPSSIRDVLVTTVVALTVAAFVYGLARRRVTGGQSRDSTSTR
ncbi:MAG: hypothetical protein QXS20_04945 [Candidatus Thorarchaeota archaeon]